MGHRNVIHNKGAGHSSRQLLQQRINWTLLVVTGLLTGMPHAVLPQSRTAQPSIDPAIMIPHRVSADTGRMAWGHQDFVSYITPEVCDRAVAAVRREVWRTGAKDTSLYSSVADTLPAAAVAVAHTCANKLLLHETPRAGIWSAMRLALAMGRDTEATTIFERAIASLATPDMQATVLEEGIFVYLVANAPRLVLAQALLDRLDALAKTPAGIGASARDASFRSHIAIMRYWMAVYELDSVKMHANVAAAMVQKMSVSERDEVIATAPYIALFDVANDRYDLEEQQAVLHRAMSVIGSWRNGKGQVEIEKRQKLLDTRKLVYGKPARTLTGTYWFKAGTTPHPAPGKVSLFVHVNHTCHGIACTRLYAVIRRLLDRYGTSVDITLITNTYGYALGTGPILPDSEAVLAARYFHDSRKLPLPLLVDARTWTRTPKGRVVYQDTPLSGSFNRWELANMVVIDRSGKIQWIGYIEHHLHQSQIEAAIDRALQQTQTGG